MKTYYNEFDPKTAAWLRALMGEGLIPKGDVDERSITDVRPGDLEGYGQCHFFAGIGGWAYALQLAGWSEPVWTGSCPCQPFSCAGKGLGEQDSRHLWPAFRELIRECRPATVFGEQVASKAGRDWLAGVFADLEGMAYLRAGADLCAAGVGAPHIRQRLYWVADAELARRTQAGTGPVVNSGRESESGLAFSRLGSPSLAGLERHAGNGHNGSEPGRVDTQSSGPIAEAGGVGWRVGIPTEHGCEVRPQLHGRDDGQGLGEGRDNGGMGESNSAGSQPGSEAAALNGHRDSAVSTGFWSDAIWHQCSDGKARRISPEPEVFPLADGLPYNLGGRRSARAPILKGSGNAIAPQLAAEFVKAYREARNV